MPALGVGCWALGATLFDTAPAYGSSEAFLGEVLGPRRQRVFLISKCGLAPDPASGRLVLDGRPEALRAHVEASLSRLRSDYLDLLLVHYPDPRVPLAETMGALAALRRAGKARSVGACRGSASCRSRWASR
ncbi:MAG: aldo/keto reductase, partial [Chloroflexi bacterium]|nr:aldo/keto reductase [Chloroflexota bacterium]